MSPRGILTILADTVIKLPLCAGNHGHIDIGGGQVQYLKSYYAVPPR